MDTEVFGLLDTKCNENSRMHKVFNSKFPAKSVSMLSSYYTVSMLCC